MSADTYEPGERPAHLIAGTAQSHFEKIQSSYRNGDADATINAATDAIYWLDETQWDLENDGDFLEHMVCTEALWAARDDRDRDSSPLYLLYATVTTVLRDFVQSWGGRQ